MSGCRDWGQTYIEQWRKTKNYANWRTVIDPEVVDQVPAGYVAALSERGLATLSDGACLWMLPRVKMPHTACRSGNNTCSFICSGHVYSFTRKHACGEENFFRHELDQCVRTHPPHLFFL